MAFDSIALVTAAGGGMLALWGLQRWSAGDRVGAACLAFMVLGVVLVIAKNPS
ncbi:hypothetical protein [Mesorhizobium sp.]|uniref:hypothetical protein n=1 Tax=Mesorhizobium sp. TaxID=1871066 RepID=UPI0025D4CB2B|nr:hypothetical protein [Mesorhizobium sp.]